MALLLNRYVFMSKISLCVISFIMPLSIFLACTLHAASSPVCSCNDNDILQGKIDVVDVHATLPQNIPDSCTLHWSNAIVHIT